MASASENFSTCSFLAPVKLLIPAALHLMRRNCLFVVLLAAFGQRPEVMISDYRSAMRGRRLAFLRLRVRVSIDSSFRPTTHKCEHATPQTVSRLGFNFLLGLLLCFQARDREAQSHVRATRRQRTRPRSPRLRKSTSQADTQPDYP